MLRAYGIARIRLEERTVHEVTGERRKLRNEERHDLLISPNPLQVIKSRRGEGGIWRV